MSNFKKTVASRSAFCGRAVVCYLLLLLTTIIIISRQCIGIKNCTKLLVHEYWWLAIVRSTFYCSLHSLVTGFPNLSMVTTSSPTNEMRPLTWQPTIPNLAIVFVEGEHQSVLNSTFYASRYLLLIHMEKQNNVNFQHVHDR